MYSVDLNEEIQTFACPDCGETSLTVWGFIHKNGTAHAVYYAGLMTGHSQISVRLTVSIGDWVTTDANRNEAKLRQWLFIEARPTSDRYELMVREPEESLYFNKPLLGNPITRAEALGSPLLEEFFAVADFVAFNDPAVKSYLSGQQVNSAGRRGFAN